MGELIELGKRKVPDNTDIATDIFMNLNTAAKDTGYEHDRTGWLKRMESVLSADMHSHYVEFSRAIWQRP